MSEGRTRHHVLQELGFVLRRDGDEIHGSAEVVPEMFVPGTDLVRTSILASWTDLITGLLAVGVIGPRVPVTLELDVHVYEEPRDCGTILAVGSMLKVGRAVVVASVDFTTAAGAPLAHGSGSFLASPDATLTLPPGAGKVSFGPNPRRLDVPLAERAGCQRRAPGVAVLPRSDDGLNSSNTINGGLIALVVEEAALSLTPGAALSALDLRYLRPLRIGPAIATAQILGDVGRVEVRDAGADDRLAVVATTRTF